MPSGMRCRCRAVGVWLLRIRSDCSTVVHRLFNGLNRRTTGEQSVNSRSGYGEGTMKKTPTERAYINIFSFNYKKKRIFAD